MRQLSAAGQDLLNGIAQRHGFSFDATMSMLESVINGNGSMAQFSHPEFAGSGQWMRGGMVMVSDMFNHDLGGRVDRLCTELSTVIADQPELVRSGSFQSQRQGDSRASGGQHQHSQGLDQQPSDGSSLGAASLFVPGTSSDWWPSDLRFPSSTGAQDGVRYAYFAQARRLVIDVGGTVTVYDTLDHQIGGFSQQQSVGGTLSFNSQHGLVDIASLPVAASHGQPPRPRAQLAGDSSQGPAAMPGGAGLTGSEPDVFAAIERLADLRTKGMLTDEEFLSKKTELLGRL